MAIKVNYGGENGVIKMREYHAGSRSLFLEDVFRWLKERIVKEEKRI